MRKLLHTLDAEKAPPAPTAAELEALLALAVAFRMMIRDAQFCEVRRDHGDDYRTN